MKEMKSGTDPFPCQLECGIEQRDCDDDLDCRRRADEGDREAGEDREQSAYRDLENNPPVPIALPFAGFPRRLDLADRQFLLALQSNGFAVNAIFKPAFPIRPADEF
jgi:hypothetical protein